MHGNGDSARGRDGDTDARGISSRLPSSGSAALRPLHSGWVTSATPLPRSVCFDPAKWAPILNGPFGTGAAAAVPVGTGNPRIDRTLLATLSTAAFTSRMPNDYVTLWLTTMMWGWGSDWLAYRGRRNVARGLADPHLLAALVQSATLIYHEYTPWSVRRLSIGRVWPAICYEVVLERWARGPGAPGGASTPVDSRQSRQTGPPSGSSGRLAIIAMEPRTVCKVRGFSCCHWRTLTSEIPKHRR